MARRGHKEPPLLEIVELADAVHRGKKKNLTLEEKRRVYVATFALVDTYFILAADAGKIKIGKTVDVKKRLSTLRTMSPVQLDLICTIRYDGELERRIHQHFAEHRAHGEWFEAHEDILSFIENYQEKGVRWVVDQVGEGPRSWFNTKGCMTEDMRLELGGMGGEFYNPLDDDDALPNTQNGPLT